MRLAGQQTKAFCSSRLVTQCLQMHHAAHWTFGAPGRVREGTPKFCSQTPHHRRTPQCRLLTLPAKAVPSIPSILTEDLTGMYLGIPLGGRGHRRRDVLGVWLFFFVRFSRPLTSSQERKRRLPCLRRHILERKQSHSFSAVRHFRHATSGCGRPAHRAFSFGLRTEGGGGMIWKQFGKTSELERWRRRTMLACRGRIDGTFVGMLSEWGRDVNIRTRKQGGARYGIGALVPSL